MGAAWSICACAEERDDDIFGVGAPLPQAASRPRSSSITPTQRLDDEVADAKFLRDLSITPEEVAALQNKEYDALKRDIWAGVEELLTICRGKDLPPRDWTIKKSKGGITLETCPIAESNSLGVKVTGTVPATPVETFSCMMDPETHLSEGEYDIKEHLGDHELYGFQISHLRVKVPLLSDSDFISGEWSGVHPTGPLLYAFKSVRHPKFPSTKGAIRGKTHVGGWSFAAGSLPGTCDVTFVSIVDPCRHIPSMLASTGAEKSAKSLAKLRKACSVWVAAKRDAGGKSNGCPPESKDGLVENNVNVAAEMEPVLRTSNSAPDLSPAGVAT